jgi:hypothetical protein
MLGSALAPKGRFAAQDHVPTRRAASSRLLFALEAVSRIMVRIIGEPFIDTSDGGINNFKAVSKGRM